MSSGRTCASSPFALPDGTLPLPAQSPTGTIGGRVVDSTSAVIPGADVSVRNMETGLTRNGITNEEGLFRFPALLVGRYEITVNMQGFKKSVVSNLELNVDARVEQTMVLEFARCQRPRDGGSQYRGGEYRAAPDLGAVVERTDVQGTAAQRAELRSSWQASTQELRPTATAVLLPAASTGAAASRSPSREAGPAPRPLSSTAYLSKSIFTGHPAAFSLSTRFRSSKSRRGFLPAVTIPPGVINLVMKSGTNRVRATLWEFHRNDNFDVRRFFDVGELPEFRQNQYGFEVGGPAIKNKLFWYTAYEGLRFFRIGQSFATVPTPAARQGDFSSLATPVIDPTTGEPFPGNRIPANRFAAFSRKFMDEGFIPLPTPGREAERLNFLGQAPTVQDDDKWLWRGDYTMSERTSSSDALSIPSRHSSRAAR